MGFPLWLCCGGDRGPTAHEKPSQTRRSAESISTSHDRKDHPVGNQSAALRKVISFVCSKISFLAFVETGPQRIKTVCECLQAEFGPGYARVAIFSADGHACIFGNSAAGSSVSNVPEIWDGTLWSYLSAGEQLTVLRNASPGVVGLDSVSAVSCQSYSVSGICTPYNHGPIQLVAGDLLALPMHLPTGRVAAALLVTPTDVMTPSLATLPGMMTPGGHRSGTQSSTPRTPMSGHPFVHATGGGGGGGTAIHLSTRDVAELRRLAEIMSLALFNDRQQAAFLEQMAGILTTILDANNPGLHDTVAAILEALPPLLYDKYAVRLQPLIAAAASDGASGSGGGAMPATAIVFSHRSTSLQVPVGSPLRACLSANAPMAHGPIAASLRPQDSISRSVQHNLFTNGSSVVAAAVNWPETRVQNRRLSEAASASAVTTLAGGPAGPTHGSAPLGISNCAQNSDLRSSCNGSSIWVGDGVYNREGVSRVKVVRTAVANTLLAGLLQGRIHQQRASASLRTDKIHRTGLLPASMSGQTNHDPDHSPETKLALSPSPAPGPYAGTCPILQPPQLPPPPPPLLDILVVPNASSRVLDEDQPGRDVLLAANLTGAGVACLLLCAEAEHLQAQQTLTHGSAGVATRAAPKQQQQQEPGTMVPELMPASRGSHASPGLMFGVPTGLQPPPSPAPPPLELSPLTDATVTMLTSTSIGGEGEMEVEPASGAGAPAATAAEAANAALAMRYRLAMYLVCSEAVPSGVLEAVAEEMKGLLPVLFDCFRAALAIRPQLSLEMNALLCGGRQQQQQQQQHPLMSQAQQEPPITITYSNGRSRRGPAAAAAAVVAAPVAGMAAAAAAEGTTSAPLWSHLAALRASIAKSAATPIPCRRSVGAAMSSFDRPMDRPHWAPTGRTVPAQLPAPSAPLPVLHPNAAQYVARGCCIPASYNMNGRGIAGGTRGGGAGPGSMCRVPRSRAGSAVPSLNGGSRHSVAGHVAVGGGGPYDTNMSGTLMVVGTSEEADPQDADGSGAPLGINLPLQPTSQDVSSRLSVTRRATTGLTRAGSCSLPLQLEDVAGPRPLELLVSSARSRLTAVAARSDVGEESRQAARQDLAGLELVEKVGQGGQGTVFRGFFHGLEVAVKVMELASQPALEHDGGASVLSEQAAASDCDIALLNVHIAWRQPKDMWPNDNEPNDLGNEQYRIGNGRDSCKDGADQYRQFKRGAMEVAIMGTLSHPNIVQVFAQFSEVVLLERHLPGHPGSPTTLRPQLRLSALDSPLLETHGQKSVNSALCLEYCDAGTLLSAARRGDFRLPDSAPRDGPMWPNLVPLYTSLLEVALALRYLHSRRLVHCDLKPGNVLLKTSTRDPRGWTCKLSDFGCVRLMDEVGPDGQPCFTTNSMYGTMPYMSPEFLQKGRPLTGAVDVYAFGIVMWELLHCRSSYNRVRLKDLPALVVLQNLRPEFSLSAPPGYRALATSCWVAVPERRPTAMQLVTRLQQLLSAAKSSASGLRQQHLLHLELQQQLKEQQQQQKLEQLKQLQEQEHEQRKEPLDDCSQVRLPLPQPSTTPSSPSPQDPEQQLRQQHSPRAGDRVGGGLGEEEVREEQYARGREYPSGHLNGFKGAGADARKSQPPSAVPLQQQQQQQQEEAATCEIKGKEDFN